ncbi:hypothetical protein ACJIZ3_002957 [Penstemon smallii]|uniref:F-box domain-containing protein n=1 Tax=Penstemon smallii TaxID=265156 RepID=A0ABD3U7W2_9LAMI
MQMKEDRISKLPDPILHQILSSINLKHAVQTSTLSKRWKHVWSSLPNLNFNYTTLDQIKCVSILMRSLYDTKFMPHFTNFATQFLSNRDHASAISKFQLTSNETGTDSRFVEKCIEYAIRHGVQELDLDTYCSPTPIKFPVGLFTSRTLKVLKVKQYTNSLVVPKPFVLPNIKTLYLDSFNFIDGDDLYSFTKEPFSSFDNLEELTLHNCEIDGMIISGLKLRNLEISFQHMLFSREKKMESIKTPRLKSFKYKGYVSLVCSVMDIPCLEEVYFDLFANLEPPYTDEIQKKMPPNLIRMLKQLGNAKFVTLTLHTIEVLC